jgi:hypothetical protein
MCGVGGQVTTPAVRREVSYDPESALPTDTIAPPVNNGLQQDDGSVIIKRLGHRNRVGDVMCLYVRVVDRPATIGAWDSFRRGFMNFFCTNERR